MHQGRVSLLFCSLVAACSGATGATGDTGSAGHSALVAIATEPAGANCATGGQRIDVGTDNNGNGTLDSDEVTSSSYICNGDTGGTGSAGATALVSITPEPDGTNCAMGGQRIDVGVDTNHDGSLGTTEIDTTDYVCNGTTGLSSLIHLTNEPAGSNCAGGGQRIDVGLDDNGDGTLEAGEIDQTAYVCNAPTAKFAYLANWAAQNSNFDIYNIAANTWSAGPALPSPSRGQLAASGSTVTMIGTDNNVYTYTAGTSAWAPNGSGPATALGSFSFIEVLDDNLYACSASSSTLNIRHAGTWSTLALPTPCSVAGGVNASAHEVYIKTYGTAGFMVVSSMTNTVSRTITDSTTIGENTSSAAYLAGAFFERSGSGNILRLDATSGARTDTGVDPTGNYDAFVGEPVSRVIYVKSGSAFSAYSLGGLTTLAAGPNQGTLGTLALTY